MAKSVTFAAAQINAARGTPTPAWTPYLALYIGDPAAGGFEVSGGSYARQAVVLTDPGVSGQSSNANNIAFPTPTADWGIVTHLVLTDALSGGSWRMSYLASGSDLQRTITSGSSPVTIGPGSLVYGEP